MMNFQGAYQFFVPIKFVNGYGSIERLGELADGLGNNFMLITGKTAMKNLGYTQKVLAMLKAKDKKTVLFDDVEPNPTTDTVDKGADILKKEKCDAVIGLGGGSAMDAAKAIAVAAGNGGKIWDYQSGNKNTANTLPIIAIPTTAGSGTDGDRYFVLTNKKLNFKEGFGFEETYPRISIIDPQLTETLTEQVTKDTAIDALGHSFESYYSKMENAFSDMIALNSIWLIFKYLPIVLDDPKNREARSALMLAATMGGIAINHGGVASPHGFAMTLGGLYNITHAHGVGVCLPFALQKAELKIGEKLSFLAKYLGWSNSDNILKNASVVVEKVHDFLDMIKFPRSLSEIGIKKNELPTIIDKVYGDEDLANDPGSYNTKEEINDFLLKII
jgi:alcohol dehydrogenase class IV